MISNFKCSEVKAPSSCFEQSGRLRLAAKRNISCSNSVGSCSRSEVDPLPCLERERSRASSLGGARGRPDFDLPYLDLLSGRKRPMTIISTWCGKDELMRVEL